MAEAQSAQQVTMIDADTTLPEEDISPGPGTESRGD